MPTRTQLEKHKTNLSGSQMPAVCHCSPRPEDLYDIWAVLTGRKEPTNIEGPHLEFGTFVEKFCARRFEEKSGLAISVKARKHRRLDLGQQAPIIVNCDLIATSEDGLIPVEVKSTGIYGPVYGEWGEEGTDQVPDWAAIQLTTQIMALGAPYGYVLAFIGGRGDVLYRLDNDADLADIVVDQADDFWISHVKADVPPPMDPPPLEVLKRFHRTGGKRIYLPAETSDYLEAKALAADANNAVRDAQARLLEKMDDAELVDGGEAGTYMYKTIPRKGYTVQPSTYRRFVKIKED